MANRLERAKAARNAAHQAVLDQIAQVRTDLAARGVGGRIVDRAGESLNAAKDVARAHKGIVAGTLGLVTLWVLRKPIIAMGTLLWAEYNERKGDDD